MSRDLSSGGFVSLYLKHYFDPDHAHLQPRLGHNKKTDLYNLGYVQNIQKDQVIAEFVPLSSVTNLDKRFIYKDATLPAGPGTYIDPQNPHRLLAEHHGYVLYNAQKIMVKSTLTVNSDVSFHTGNIVFIGDTIVQGNVRAGFSVYGQNIEIKGMIEGGNLNAKQSIIVIGGARGAATKRCVLKAKENVRLNFAEKIEVYTQANVIVSKYALHSSIYAGTHAIIQNQMIGGNIHALKSVYVGKQLGNRAAVPTRIYLGYDPLLIRRLEKIDQRIDSLSEKLHHLNAVAGHLAPNANELARKLDRTRKKHNAYIYARDFIWNTLCESQDLLKTCKVVAAGQIYPGTEISIGRFYLQINEFMQGLEFFIKDNEIIYTPHIPKA